MGVHAAQRHMDVRAAIAGRTVAWFGIRGTDSAAMLKYPEFGACFAITAPPQAASLEESQIVTMESISRHRVDLDRYDLDFDPSPAADEFRSQVRRALGRRSIVMTYRPSGFISSLGFALSDNVTVAGPFTDRQRGFEYKPWVESELRQRGVDVLPWVYVGDQDQHRAIRMVTRGPIVLRSSRDSGGLGVALVSDPDELVARWPNRPEHFVAVAPYFAEAVPLNVSGCVYRDGSVTVHPPSVQLIGVEGCTEHKFGYCGNDFGAIRALDRPQLAALDRLVRQVGGWLAEERYLGVFGIDALLHGGTVYFTEINPRFQGSTALSAVLAASMEESDLLTEHLAAHLGLTAPEQHPTVLDWARDQPPSAHLVVHSTAEADVRLRTDQLVAPPDLRMTNLPPADVVVEPGGVLARLVSPAAITADGYSVNAAIDSTVRLINGSTASAASSGVRP